jgi:mRNA interferase RelE/StbE
MRKLDRPIAARIIGALERLATMSDPAAHCKALAGPLAGYWRLRVGDYRIILDIRAERLVILALDVGHRSTIY